MYRELGLAMRRRKRRHSGQRLAAAATTRLERANQRWAMDFVSDTLAHGRTFRVLTIIDEYTRECLAVEADTSLPGLRVVRVLQQLAETRGMPEEIHVDHGPEFICRSIRSWCEEHRVLLRYIEPGRPMQNAYASHCTSFERSGMTEAAGRRSDSFVPCAFMGLSAPGGSYRHSGFSVYAWALSNP